LSQSFAISEESSVLQDSPPDEGTAVPFTPEYNVTQGKYVNSELGFSITLPEKMTGFISEYYSYDGSKSIDIQIHPEFNSTDPTQCCPVIDTSPAVFMLDDIPLSSLSTPVPFTGDIFAAFQGYNMRMNIGNLNGTEVLVSTLSSDRDDIPGYTRHVGKFYFMNSGDRFLSYGIWGSEEGYQKFEAELDSSAKTLSIKDPKPLNLTRVFGSQYEPQQLKIDLADGSTANAKILSSSTIESIAADEKSNTLTLHLNQTSSNDFLVLTAKNLLAGPHVVTIGGTQAESATLESTEGDRYVLAFYNGTASGGEVSISGSQIMPEFGSGAILVVGAAILTAFAGLRYMDIRRGVLR